MINLARTILSIILLFSALPLGSSTWAQSPAEKKSQTKSEAKTDESEASRLSDAEALKGIEAQRRAFAISLVMSLADEARSYRDLALRPRVLARAADTLWDVDSNAARTQFRRAWEAAEKALAIARAALEKPETKAGTLSSFLTR